jgi:hypothetical protein
VDEVLSAAVSRRPGECSVTAAQRDFPAISEGAVEESARLGWKSWCDSAGSSISAQRNEADGRAAAIQRSTDPSCSCAPFRKSASIETKSLHPDRP